MSFVLKFLNSSLGKKYIMALSGLVLVLFVLGHMVGNMQVFLDPYWINAYGYKLQNLPYGLLYVVRAFMLATVAAHVWAAITLVMENRAARPERYEADDTVQASYASRTMWISGPILLLFILFHLAHYTIRVVPEHGYNEEIRTAAGQMLPVEVYLVHEGHTKINAYGEPIVAHNVHGMMVAGFSHWWISGFYLVSMALLCIHLTHGVSSMFQSLGWRNEVWRKRLDCIANAYGWIVFIGFAIIPLSIMARVSCVYVPEEGYPAAEAHHAAPHESVMPEVGPSAL